MTVARRTPEELREAELLYREEYRRKIRRERMARLAMVREVSETTEAAESEQKPDDALELRRRRTAEILEAGAQVYETAPENDTEETQSTGAEVLTSASDLTGESDREVESLSENASEVADGGESFVTLDTAAAENDRDGQTESDVSEDVVNGHRDAEETADAAEIADDARDEVIDADIQSISEGEAQTSEEVRYTISVDSGMSAHSISVSGMQFGTPEGIWIVRENPSRIEEEKPAPAEPVRARLKHSPGEIYSADFGLTDDEISALDTPIDNGIGNIDIYDFEFDGEDIDYPVDATEDIPYIAPNVDDGGYIPGAVILGYDDFEYDGGIGGTGDTTFGADDASMGEEYSRALRYDNGRRGDSEPVGDLRYIDPVLPYDGKDVDEVSGGYHPENPAMLEEEEMLAFLGYTRPNSIGEYYDGNNDGYVVGYDLPGEERGADVGVHIGYTADNGDMVVYTDITGGEERTNALTEEEERERDMAAFIDADRRSEQRRRARRGLPKRDFPTEPTLDIASLGFNRGELKRKKRVETENDEDMFAARHLYEMTVLGNERQRLILTIGDEDKRVRREIRRISKMIKKGRKTYPRVKKFERADNKRYYSLVMTDIAKLKTSEARDAAGLVLLRDRVISLLSERDKINLRLSELYLGCDKGRRGGTEKRAKVLRRARLGEWKMQSALYKKVRRMHADYDYRQRVEEIMNEQVRLMGEIKLCEFMLEDEKVRGEVRRQVKRRREEAISRHKKNRRAVIRIRGKVEEAEGERKKEQLGVIFAWVALGVIAALVGLCIWQWDAIFGFLLENIPGFADAFGGGGDLP